MQPIIEMMDSAIEKLKALVTAEVEKYQACGNTRKEALENCGENFSAELKKETAVKATPPKQENK